MNKPRLGEILVARGLAPREQVAAVLAQKNAGKLASELFRLGVASERALALGLAEQRGHPAVVLSESSLDLSALELVPRVIAEQHRLLPIAIDSDTITLAVADIAGKSGEHLVIFDQIEFATGRRVHVLLAVESVIAEAVAVAYEAKSGGESVLVGAVDRPAGVPALMPLSIVRPPSTALPALHDPLLVPSAPPAAVPVIVGSMVSLRPQVLVVDDEEDIRVLLRKLLTFDGYDVEEARTGREALEKLRTLRPSLILLDAMLPEIHGFDICATLKKSSAFKDTPVVVVSAVYKGWEHARTVQETHGADAFVEKPFDVHYLRQLVARLVGKELPKNQLTIEWVKKIQALREEAEVHYNLGDFDSCDEVVKQWKTLDPFDAHPWLLSGNAKSKMGDLEGAMKALERACTFDATLFPAFKNLAVIYERLGFQQRSAMAWYRAYELAPDGETRRRIEEHLNAREQVRENRS